MKSKKAKSLSLRRVKSLKTARVLRKTGARLEEIKATPEGRFIFGQQWTPEQIAAFKAKWDIHDWNGMTSNRLPVSTNGITHAREITDGARESFMWHNCGPIIMTNPSLEE